MSTSFQIALCAGFALLVSCLIPAFALDIFVMGILMTLLLMALSAAVQQQWLKYVCIALFSLTLPLTFLEGYAFFLKQHYMGLKTQYVREGGTHIKRDAVLGYTGNPSSSVRERHIRDDVTLYDARYTLNEHGQRITPQHPHARHAVLLFGCSFAFGDGLNDDEALAWQLAKRLGDDYQVFNLALSGYGPHHMLAIVENTLPDLSQYEDIAAYYMIIRSHENRAAGLKFEDSEGPRYVLEGGKAVRMGSFKDEPPLFWEGKYEHIWEKSNAFTFYKQQLAQLLVPLNTPEKRFALTRAIIGTAAQTLHQKYPQSTFRALAYPPEIMSKLPPLPDDIPLVDVEAWLPNFAENPDKYRIPIDKHPNALAMSLVAEQLEILVREGKQAPVR